MPKPTTKPKAQPQRPAPVSLRPLTVEQALGALLRTPQPGSTTEDDEAVTGKPEKAK